MSAEQDDIQPADSRSETREKSHRAVRGDWSGWKTWTAEEQARIDLNECTDARCMNVEVNVGYQGLVDDSVLSQSAGVGNDLRAAWKSKLAGEGKQTTGKSLRDSIFGPSEPNQ